MLNGSFFETAGPSRPASGETQRPGGARPKTKKLLFVNLLKNCNFIDIANSSELGCPRFYLPKLLIDMEKVAPYQAQHKIRIVTAAALFDGHDAAINIMRRIMQRSGAEVIHLGHDRSVYKKL